jgi:hypothetical protein
MKLIGREEKGERRKEKGERREEKSRGLDPLSPFACPPSRKLPPREEAFVPHPRA